jgi:PD-(D/E)XK nuclease superfamily
MFVQFHCPECRKLLKVGTDKVGLRAKCPVCQSVFTVPGTQVVAQPAPIQPVPIPPQVFPEISNNENAPSGPNETPLSENEDKQFADTTGQTHPLETELSPAKRSVLNPGFLTSLQAVFESEIEREPDEFVIPLADIFRTRRKAVEERRRHFLACLKHISDFEEVVEPDDYVQSLATQLLSWRASARAQMNRLVQGLPDHDPLTCPISLFGTLSLRRTETAHTSALAWLLDPSKPHGFGSALLEALLAHCLRSLSHGPVVVSSVEKEYPIAVGDRTGRIDVFAIGESTNNSGGWLLAIEAKVDAREGDGQLELYDSWIAAHRYGRHPIRVFLTQNGDAPEGESDHFPDPWIPLSFLDLVRVFRQVSGSLHGKPGFEYLRYYLTGVLKDIYLWQIPVPAADSCTNPYAYVSFLKTIERANERGN